MNHISLFSGMGGFDLAAEWMGWNNIAHCEWKPFNQRILKYYWPEAISYNDITKSDFTIHRGTIDIVTGGFPCQPYSVAGKRKGKEDERHLWPEMLRAIREIQPAWVVGENVRGIINWSDGMVFDEVQAQLEIEGYEVLPFLLPAAGVNAPHERYRTWFVAYSKCYHDLRKISGINGEEEKVEGVNREKNCTAGESCRTNCNDAKGDESIKYDSSNSGNKSRQQNFERGGEEYRQEREKIWCNIKSACKIKPATDPIDNNWRSAQGNRDETGEFIFSESERSSEKRNPGQWEWWPTVAPICNGDDGFPPRLDNITFSKWRNESIMSGGNAIVPQVALQIFKSIQQFKEL